MNPPKQWVVIVLITEEGELFTVFIILYRKHLLANSCTTMFACIFMSVMVVNGFIEVKRQLLEISR